MEIGIIVQLEGFSKEDSYLVGGRKLILLK
jgi:hypothetical protein